MTRHNALARGFAPPAQSRKGRCEPRNFTRDRRDLLVAIRDCVREPARLADAVASGIPTSSQGVLVGWLEDHGYLARVRVGSILSGLEVTPAGLAWLAGVPVEAEQVAVPQPPPVEAAGVVRAAGGGVRVIKKPEPNS